MLAGVEEPVALGLGKNTSRGFFDIGGGWVDEPEQAVSKETDPKIFTLLYLSRLDRDFLAEFWSEILGCGGG